MRIPLKQLAQSVPTDGSVVHLSGTETITGIKSFSTGPVLTPGAAPSSPVAGQLWVDTTDKLKVHDGTRFHTSTPTTLNVKDYGAIGDGVTDDAAALDALITSIPWSGYGGGNVTILFPPGKYRRSTAWEINRTVIIQGSGTGQYDDGGTTILFDNGVTHGIRLMSNADSPDGHGAQWSQLRDICIYMAGGWTSANDGVVARVTFGITNCMIGGWGGNGLTINTDPAGTNANKSYVNGLRIATIGGSGIFIRGINTNICSFVSVDCSVIRNWGIWDLSLCGNTYVGCHVATTGYGHVGGTAGVDYGAYYMHASTGNVMFGCYSEMGDISDIGYSNMCIGGCMAGGFGGTGGGQIIMPGAFSPFSVTSGTWDNASPNAILSINDGHGEMRAYTNSDLGVVSPAINQYYNRYDYGAMNQPPAFSIYGPSSSISDGYDMGRIYYPRGVWMGGFATPDNGIRLQVTGSAHPIEGAINNGVQFTAEQGSWTFTNQGKLLYANANVGGGATWRTPWTLGVGGACIPTVANGYVYRVHNSSTGFTTGPTEPTWPTTLGVSVTESTGLKWVCYGVTDSTKLVEIASVGVSGTDTSGTPGDATVNKPSGIATIASGATTCVITSSYAHTTSRINIDWYGDSGAARSWTTRANGSFTVTLSSAAAGNTSFGWEIQELA